MKKLVALVECWHNGTHRAGESFEADSEQNAMILVAIGHARYEDVMPPAAHAPVQTRAMKAEANDPPPAQPAEPMNTQSTPDLVPPKSLKKGKYKRRDMRADD